MQKYNLKSLWIIAGFTYLFIAKVCIYFNVNATAIYRPSSQIFDINIPKQPYMPITINELQNILQRAQLCNKKVSIVGAGKSQGGQTISSYADSYRVSLNKLNKLISLDKQRKQVTVEAGMTWKELQQHIAPHSLAIKVMQSYNDFSIGGSISVNVHGQDLSTGQIISTVLSLQVLLPSGEIITVSRQKNASLYSAILGGYGLVGIIVAATLQLTEDVLLKRAVKIISTSCFVDYFNRCIRNNNDIGFYSARFSVGRSDFMKKVFVITHKKLDSVQQAYPLYPTKQSTTSRKMIQAIGSSSLLKECRFSLENLMLRSDEIISRNNLLNYSIQGLPKNDNTAEYILQEYFLPYNQLISFINKFRKLVQQHDINILNVTARHVLHDSESLLSFAPHNDMCALVVYIKLPRFDYDRNNITVWSRRIIDQIIHHQGTYYLPYHLFATQKQFESVYPKWSALLQIKQKYDLCNILSNQLYERYS